MNRRRWLSAMFAGLVALTGGAAMAETKTITGTVTYLNRSMLPPGAVLDLQLVDVSRADAPSIQLSAQRYAINRVPFPFTLTYDAALIEERLTYGVQARISQGEKVLYRSTSFNVVLTHSGTDSVDIIVDLMPAVVDKKPDQAIDQRLEGSNWQAYELGGKVLITDERPSISFLPDGKVSMRGGCNRFNGEAEISGADIDFSDRMAGTLMAGPPPLDTLERDFLEALGAATTYLRTDNRLSLINSAGMTVMRLGLAP